MIIKIITILAIIAFGLKPDGKYVILLQNNNELRATGGFMGSYAVLQFKKGNLEQLRISDIYTPDGQLPGHVEPPAPIQKAFQNGEWRLRDSNWDPDFTIAAPKIVWFFEQGGEENIDGVVAINFDLAKDFLAILGSIKTPDYPETINAANLYELAQKHAELNFFPGSTQKRDFLGSVGKTILQQTKVTSLANKIKLADLVITRLKQKQILLWAKDIQTEKRIKDWKFDGGLNYRGGNYLYIVESNLGANKANCCVSRKVTHEINGVQEKITFDFKNDSLFKDPVPPVFWGGNYINYLRVIIPAKAKIKSVRVGGIISETYDEEVRGELRIVGFWLTVPFQKTMRAELIYEKSGDGLLLVKRQPGLSELQYKLIVNGQTVADEKLKIDKTFVMP